LLTFDISAYWASTILKSLFSGGDEPEAVADAMHDLLKLSWRDDSAKLAVLVSDAPPHGIGAPSDTMPNGTLTLSVVD